MRTKPVKKSMSAWLAMLVDAPLAFGGTAAVFMLAVVLTLGSAFRPPAATGELQRSGAPTTYASIPLEQEQPEPVEASLILEPTEPGTSEQPVQAISVPTLAPTGTAEALDATALPALPVPPSFVETHSPRKYQVVYTAVLYNNGYNIQRAQVYQAHPRDWQTQTITGLEVWQPPTLQTSDEHGNLVDYWELHQSPAVGANQEFGMSFNVTVYALRSKINADALMAYDTSTADYRRYTSPETYIESDSAVVKALAEQLAGEESNPYRLAKRFFDAIPARYQYWATGDGIHGAQFLVDKGWGECGDFVALFVALCRSAGIPARPVVGYFAESGLTQGHVWAEFYLEGVGWLPVDPTLAEFSPARPDDFFGQVGNDRIILNKGYNLTLSPEPIQAFTAPFMQVPWWWFEGAGSVASVVLERTAWTVTPLD